MAILIIARNNLGLTRLAVKSALAQTFSTSTMVIDNASADGTREWVRAKQNVAYVSYGTRKSLAACWNMGLRALFNAEEKEVLVLNNDVEIPPHFYDVLAACNLPFVSGVSVNSPAQLTPWVDEPGIRAKLVSAARPHPDFSAFMIRPEVIEKAGYFNEDYFPAYAEDCDYHIRMHRAGINALCVDLPFYHAVSSTLKSASPEEAALIRKGADANRDRFRRQYGCLPGTEEYSKLFAQASLV